MMSAHVAAPACQVILIYDTECPACRYYVALTRIEAVATVTLVSARSEQPVVKEAVRRGYDLNRGMVLIVGQTWYFGAAVPEQLALMGSDSPQQNRLHYWLFAVRWRARLLYPVLAWGRRRLLWLLRVPPIRPPRL